MLIILFLMLFIVVYICLIDKSIEKYKKSIDKKYNGLIKRIKILEYNQNTTFDYITDMYNELERSGKYEENEEC